MDAAQGYRVTGIVQGVGFRFWAQRQAQRLGLTGYVRNAPDGSVEIQARGSSQQLERFRAALQHGPSGAKVEAVELLPPAIHEMPNQFEIRR